jgi:membrane-associated phospholipid phosphatase
MFNKLTFQKIKSKKYLLLIILLLFTSSDSFSQLNNISDSSSYNEPQNIDVKIFRAINNSRSNFINSVIPYTDKSLMPVSILLPITLFTVSRINERYYDENSALLIALSELTATTITYSIKNIVKRERPFRTLKNVYHNRKRPETDRFSFPSGHTTTSFALATSLTLRYPDKPILISCLYFYATVVSLGRVYLGVHYPSDNLGGIIVGTGSAFLIHALRKDIINAKNYLFKESGRKDSNTSSDLSLLILSSIISTDIINYFISNSSNKNINRTRFNFSSDGSINQLNFSYNF